MQAVRFFSLWVHILVASVWIGGMAFLGLVLVPVLRKPEPRTSAADLIHLIGVRFRTVGWICLALLVVTGVINLTRWTLTPTDILNPELWRTGFGRTLGAKLILVLAILAISAAHDFVIGPRAITRLREAPDSEEAQRIRRAASRIGRLNLLLAVIVVALAVMMTRGSPW